MKRIANFLSLNLPIAAYLLVLLTGSGVSAPAQASQGRCKWEGGPGVVMHPSCKKEDCLGEGGFAMCTAPEIRPPLGLSDSQVDDDKFGYEMCDVAPPSVPRDAHWCAVQGGTWTGSANGCVGLPSQYPDLRSAANEGAALSAGSQFMTSGSCPPVMSNDTGWGLVDNSGQWCWSAAPIYQNGELLRDMRKQTWTAQPSCGGGGDVKYRKTRRLVCPSEYATRMKPNGDLQCFIPQAMCNVHGNPVDCSIGAKLETQSDYRAADGLEFTRYYNSQGRYRPPNLDGSGFLSEPSDYWRHSFSRRLIFVSGNPNLAAVLRTDNGYLVAFDASGAEIFNKTGAANRLESLGASGWRIIKPSSDIEYFDSLGRPTSVVTRAGLTTTLGYNGTGQLTMISNDFGRTITLNYTAGVLSSITIPGGAQISYAYDDLRRLVTVTSADSTTRTYHYEDADNGWLLTGITDENAVRFSTYSYDSGYVASEEHAGGVNRYSFQVGDPKDENNSSVVIDPLGKSRTFTSFNTNGVHKIQQTSAHCPSCPNISGSSFDGNGNYAHKTDFNGRRTNYVHDLTRNLETSRTEGLVGSGTATAVTRTTTTEWHPTSRLPTVTRVFAGATATGTPLRVTTMSHDGSGNVLSRAVEDPATSVTRTWSYTYDGFGRALTEDGPRTDVADVIVYAYYQCTYGAECGQLHTVTNALGHVTTYNTYNAHGQATLITDPNGVQTLLTYDARQRLSSRTAAYGTADAETTTFEYWPTGLLKKVVQPDASFLLSTYDDAHRLIRVEDGAGNKVEYVLDGAGNRQATNSFDPYGTLIRTQRQLYDSLGQLWQVLTASGTDTEATVYSYDQNGMQTTVSAPLGRVTTNAYDELSRLKQVIDPAGGVTAFGYNALDDLSQVSDPRGLITTYQYSGVGDLTQLVSPDTGATVFGYDSGGNQQTATNARNAVTTHTYDVANRVSTTSFSVAGVVDQAITFTYDAGLNGKGRLTGASDANHSLAWSYDAQGMVTNKSQTVGSVTKTIAYAFDNGRPTSVLTPSGQAIAYQYDDLGRISGITLNGSILIENVTYDAFGPATGWTWSNNTLTVHNFDLDGRMDLIDSAGLSTYGFNADGSIASRLDDADGSYVLAPGTTNAGVSTTSNRLNSMTGVMQRTYSFDAAGNTTGDGSATFTYNFANRMSSATKNGVTGTYTYNALGQRIRKNVGGATTYFVYDEAGHLLGQYDGAGALIEEIAWMGDVPVASVRPAGAGAGAVSVYYIHTDHLNTPRRVSRPADNQIVWRWDSDPYGEASANEDVDGDSQAFAFHLRFPGQFLDLESGLHYNYFRDYDPSIGRYVESDPIGLYGGTNTYLYVAANPLSNFDPMGLCWSNSRAVAHFYGGGGSSVTIDQIGCRSQIDGRVSPERTLWKSKASAAAKSKAYSMTCGSTAKLSLARSVGVNSGIFWIGGFSLRQTGDCVVSRVCGVSSSKICTPDSYSFTCGLNSLMHDLFEHPSDFDNSAGSAKSDFWDEWNYGGSPFYVDGSWKDTVQGGGLIL